MEASLDTAQLAASAYCGAADASDGDGQSESEGSEACGDGRRNDPWGWAVVIGVYFELHICCSIAERAGDVEGEDPLSCAFEGDAHVEVAHSDLDGARLDGPDGCIRRALCVEGQVG